jgi:hypothetical protein
MANQEPIVWAVPEEQLREWTLASLAWGHHLPPGFLGYLVSNRERKAEHKKRDPEKSRERSGPEVPTAPAVPGPDDLLEDLFQPGVTLEQEWNEWLAMLQRVNEPQPDEPDPEENSDGDDS